jgi:glycosyltransferase involved in cell wall biosynthesis
MATVTTENSWRMTNTGDALRIGFVMHAMETAGAELLVERLIHSAQGRLKPTIFCLDSLGKRGEQMRMDGMDVISLSRQSGIDWHLPAKFAREINKRQIQILHAHQYAPFLYSAMARIRGAKAKIIFTEHGRHYPDVVSRKRRWANRLVFHRLADATNACSEFSASALWRKEGFPKSNVTVVPNGVDTDYFRPTNDRHELRASLGLAPERRYIACIARFHPVKDHGTLLEAFAQLAKSRSDVHLLLVGDGTERDRLSQMVAEESLTERVHFLGIRSDVRDILAAADVFTLTSLSEAASLTLLEALSCGCPAVVTDVGGNSEIVRHGIEGYLNPRRQPLSLARSFEMVLDMSQEDWQSMSSRCRQRVLSQFRQEQTVAADLRLYENTARGKS